MRHIQDAIVVGVLAGDDFSSEGGFTVLALLVVEFVGLCQMIKVLQLFQLRHDLDDYRRAVVESSIGLFFDVSAVWFQSKSRLTVDDLSRRCICRGERLIPVDAEPAPLSDFAAVQPEDAARRDGPGVQVVTGFRVRQARGRWCPR